MQTNILLDAANHWAAQQAEAIRIARAGMERDFPVMFALPECTCDQDPLGRCPVDAAEHTDEDWNAILADCLNDLPSPRLYRAVFGLCAGCGGTADWDADTCGHCYDEAREHEKGVVG